MIDSEGNFLRESKRSFPDPLTSLYKLSGLTYLFPKSKRFGRYYLGFLDEHKNHKVDVLSGAFMLLSRNVLEKVRGFDEDFFMYGEDIDLSYRIQGAGFVNYYFTETTIIHFKGESTSKGSLNYVKMFYKAMSVFVRKHYKSGKAGAYNLFIQIGIFLRGIISAFSRSLTWIGVPVMDILAILLSFWLSKKLWALYLLPYLAFDKKILLILFPFYTIIFLAIAYFSGLYDNGYRQKRMNIAFALSILILFTIYALVPASERFSRGVLLTAVLVSFLLMTLIRFLLTSFNIIKKAEKNQEEKIVIIGSLPEYEAVTKLLISSGSGGNIIGWIGNGKKDENQIGDCEHLLEILKTTLVDKAIFCQGTLSYHEIIQSVDQLPRKISAAFYSESASAIIGSKYKSLKGVYNLHENYRLSDPVILRLKRLTDIGIALSFLLTFPVHLFIKKKPCAFFKNCIGVIFNKKTFVGYTSQSENLPPLKPGILTTIRQSKDKNHLASQFLIQSDKIYAKSYTILIDLKLIFNGYQRLS